MKIQRRLTRAGMTAVFTALLAAAASAQAAAETPEAVAGRYVAAMRAGDWAAVSRLSHPEALGQLKEMYGQLVAAEPENFGEAFFNVRSKEAYDRLSGAAVFERLMGALSRRVPEFAAAVTASEAEIVGHVAEGPDLAHVVYRMRTKVGAVTASKTAVMTLRRDGEGWRALLAGNLEGMAAALAGRGKAPDASPGRTRGRRPSRPRPRRRAG